MKILAIGAHPDDIEIGCGGTLIKYARAGHNVSLLVLTGGGFGGEVDTRKREQAESVKAIGAVGLLWGDYQDTELVDDRQLITVIEEAVKKTSPDIVFLNYPEDTHQDHRALAHAGVSATRYIKEVLFFEVPTTSNFVPDIFVDVGGVFEEKMKLLKAHASQIERTRVENLTILESAQACLVFRGYQGRVKHAEGFKALRILREIGP